MRMERGIYEIMTQFFFPFKYRVASSSSSEDPDRVTNDFKMNLQKIQGQRVFEFSFSSHE